MTYTPRQEVWIAISDLFLDTDVTRFQDNILQVCRASGFDLATLDDIFIRDVYPACIANLYDIGGEWITFDPSALIRRIERRQGRLLFGRFTLWLRWRRARDMVPEWFKIRTLLSALET